MQPPNPVTIPPNVDVTMKATDYLIFKFTLPGMFCSVDADDFIPSLPHGQTFAGGATWPPSLEYPNGARPNGVKNSTYSYNTGPNPNCNQSPAATVSRTIHVSSSKK